MAREFLAAELMAEREGLNSDVTAPMVGDALDHGRTGSLGGKQKSNGWNPGFGLLPPSIRNQPE